MKNLKKLNNLKKSKKMKKLKNLKMFNKMNNTKKRKVNFFNLCNPRQQLRGKLMKDSTSWLKVKHILKLSTTPKW